MHHPYALHTKEADEAARRIRQYSSWLSAVVPILMLALPVGLVWHWVDTPAEKIALMSGVNIQQLLPWQRIAACAVSMLPVIFVLIGLHRVRLCFKLFANGSFFTLSAIQHLRRFAAAIFGAGLAGIVTPSLLSILLTAANGPGQRQFVIGVNTGQLLLLLMSGFVWIVAAVMARAAAIEEEHAQFI